MKKIVLSTALLFSLNSSFAAVVAVCKNAMIPMGEDDRGNWVWEKTDLNIEVRRIGPKYSAVIKMGGETSRVSKGIEVVSFQGTKPLGDFIDILNMARISPKKVQSGTFFNFHPEANRDDAAGVSLTVLYSKEGKEVAKIFQAGWGIGLCK